MKYAIYFKYNDGFEDSIIVNGACDRVLTIKDMIDRREFNAIAWSKIYKSGEYGKRHFEIGGI